jgi:FKBP-type peptidyl-prolyl cis-trans isomerase 2
MKVTRAEVCNNDYEVDIEENGTIKTYSLVEADDLYGESNINTAIEEYLQEMRGGEESDNKIQSS